MRWINKKPSDPKHLDQRKRLVFAWRVTML